MISVSSQSGFAHFSLVFLFVDFIQTVKRFVTLYVDKCYTKVLSYYYHYTKGNNSLISTISQSHQSLLSLGLVKREYCAAAGFSFYIISVFFVMSHIMRPMGFVLSATGAQLTPPPLSNIIF